MMADFARCLPFTLQEEGGWSDDPADAGGPTMHGITLATLTAWRKAQDEHAAAPTAADLRAISDDEVRAIYATRYFNVIRGADLPRGIDLAVFDFAVTSGPREAALELQRALGMTGVELDGAVGPLTIARAAQANGRTLLVSLIAGEIEFYVAASGFPRFGRGWIARALRRLLAA